jgi:hypothetical protein
MAKRIERDGKFYRIRRGKEVEIPEQWVGQTVHPQELRSRKRTRQQRDADAPARVRQRQEEVDAEDDELRQRADGRSITPVDDAHLDELYFDALDAEDEDDPSVWDGPEEISQSEAEAEADAYTPHDDASDDDFASAIEFCDCENCAR